MAMLCTFLCVNAQEKLETYSVYDVNHDAVVTVSDVADVVDRAKKLAATDKQVVDADALNRLLSNISERLSYVEEKLGLAHKGHRMVDLGLSVKWASCNVGANTPEDSGDFFAWGETEAKDSSNWENYKWADGSSATLTKYCNSSAYGTVDNKSVLESSDDVASVQWGGSWRMPTSAEIDELCNPENCTWVWTAMNGVKGYKITSVKNGNSIFIPAGGRRINGTPEYVNERGFYWSSSLNATQPTYANRLYFTLEKYLKNGDNRTGGQLIRPVLP